MEYPLSALWARRFGGPKNVDGRSNGIAVANCDSARELAADEFVELVVRRGTLDAL